MTDRGTVKTSTILIAAGRRLRIYHTIEEVPATLRRRLLKSTSGANAGTVLIADRRGARELLRANIKALADREPDRRPALPALLREDILQTARLLRTYWVPASALAAAGMLWWALSSGLFR